MLILQRVLLFLSLGSSFCHAQSDSTRYDVILRNGAVHRGDGTPSARQDVAVKDGVIVEVAADLDVPADVVIDCAGLVVCPGFIDLHNHSDGEIERRDTRANVNYLMQGCTTVVTGNCGFGPVQVDDYLDRIDKQGAGTNVAHLLPQGSLRSRVMGKADRVPEEMELEEMRNLAAAAMQEGAFGMSTGLIYIPGTFTSSEELIAIASVIADHDGIYVSHIRGEGTSLLSSVEEAIRIGHEAGTPVHISHFKASGIPAWGTLRLAVDRVERARSEGQIVTADQYPYPASSTSLAATLLPAWAREGGREESARRLQDSTTLDRIRQDIQRALPRKGRIQIASCKGLPQYTGRALRELADEQAVDVVELVIQIEARGGAQVVHFGMQEEEVRSVMPLPWLATASDGGTKVISAAMPHPRSFGTFTRKIGYYARDEQVISLEHAIRSATSLPAEILGLTDRGLVATDLVADITVFDPLTIRDRATFAEPYLQSTGVKHVLVNGQFAVHDGIPTGRLAGRSVRKQSPVATPNTNATPQ